ncbi:MAG: hypothetical protein M3179_10420 [Actinomycetota bacterium]|nr:hypothetical protein [Actinomycetota bacterium]
MAFNVIERRAVLAAAVLGLASVIGACGDGNGESTSPSTISTTTTVVSTTTSTSTTTQPATTRPRSTAPPSTAARPTSVVRPALGAPCALGSLPDCIDPDGDGQGTYLQGGAACMRELASSPELCSDLDGDGVAGYPDSG